MPSDDPSLVLAVDIGTSSVRTALFDRRAKRLTRSLAQRAHAVSHSAEGAAELDPATLRRGLEACLRKTLPHAGNRRISDVGISCFWHSLIGADVEGQALTPVITWADSRCRVDAARWRDEVPEAEYHALTGCMLRASYWPAKLRWLARTQKPLWKRVARWQSPVEWLLASFCDGGAGVCAHGMATGTGLYNPAKLRWNEDIVQRCGLQMEQLPTLSEEPLTLRQSLRRRWPQLADARWWPAIGDGAAANLGSGATREGRAAISVGTSAAFRVMREGTIGAVPPGLFCYRVDPRRCVVGGAVSNAGNLRAWCRRELNLPENDTALDRALSARSRPLEGLVVLPFWTAERAPTWHEEIGGTVIGLSQHTTALDLLQATTEAGYQRLAMIAALSLPARAKRSASTTIIVSGGILKSSGLLQRLANVLGRPVHPCREPEASLRGAAVYALERNGVVPGETGLIGRAVRPRAKPAALYKQGREKQQRLEEIIAEAGGL